MKLKLSGLQLSIFVFISLYFSGYIAGQEPDINPRNLIKNSIRFPGKSPLKLVVPLKEEDRDLTPFLYVNSEIANLGSETVRVTAYLNNRWVDGSVRLEPGEKKILQILIKRDDFGDDSAFPGMHGKPGGFMWLPFLLFPSTLPYNDNVKAITYIIKDTENADVVISRIWAGGKYIAPGIMAKQPGMFPIVDKYGQYIYALWPGKVNTDNDMKEAAGKEKNELDIMPGPSYFDRFGGWLNGPLLKATGHFRLEKYNDRWWFVDPNGRLFWSMGLCNVNLGSVLTEITSRERFFSELPSENGEWSFCYRSAGGKKTFNFGLANLYRKYGNEWKEKATYTLLKRLRSWGVNSAGNWSDLSLNELKKNPVPYFRTIRISGPRLDGKKKGFPDVFNPGFRDIVQKAVENVTDNSKDDSLCIGYFIDNELDVRNLTEAVMTSEPNSEAKKALISFLEKKYNSVENLNNSWKTEFNSWTNLSSLSVLPQSASSDMLEFDVIILDKYYRTCSEILKQNAPLGLYFGSRLNTHYYPEDQNETHVIKTAAKYCDAVGFNIYRFIISDLILPEGIDKPSIIGEFHFGALDRGFLHTGLRSVPDQNERAEAYEDYLTAALKNPQIVGAHWFRYQDEPVTAWPGSNAENYEIGFVDVCDNPYPVLINSARKISYSMYKIRAAEK